MLIPLGGRVIVRPSPENKMTPGGLHLPDSHRPRRPLRGKVIASGSWTDVNGVDHLPVVQPGQEVIFLEFCGDPYEYKNEKLVILKPDEVIAVVYPE